jgi:SOUL heme-binding protein
MIPLLGLFGFLVFAGRAAAAEEPPYGVVRHEGSFEIRDYPALALAEVTAPGDRNSAAYSGFRKLAGYIFGRNARKQSIEMTAPVIEARAGAGMTTADPTGSSAGAQGWVIRFVMPRELSVDALPKPDDQAITLREAPPARVAVVRFSGLAGDDAVAAKTVELQAFVKARGLSPIGPPVIAQYDPPWTLWFMRRNEIMMPIGR